MTNTPPPEELMAMADLLRPAAIRSAATLRLADHIADGAATVDELVEATNTHPEVLPKLLRYLTSIGVLRMSTAGRYSLAPLGALLLDDHPAQLRRHLSTDGPFGRADLGLVRLLHTVRTGQACHEAAFGRSYWEDLNEDPAVAGELQDLIPGELGWDADLVVNAYDWSTARRVVDVGGNTGTLLIELVRRHRHLHGTLVDLQNVARIAGRRFEEAELSHRCEAVIGSFFDPLVPGGDVYLLSAVLADWDDEHAVRILRRCADAAGPDGRVLLAEVNLPVDESQEAAGAALWLRAIMPAPVRSVEELKRLGAAAGLRVTWEGPATAVRSLLEFSVAPREDG
ncbi:methyltransferase [Kitasatospora sp. NPDC059827]|uniref:methyltransferase n=1 Tax=Kitasatospora sp. NPDC059827 TaxID=3346964 RepID=UPI003649AFC2